MGCPSLCKLEANLVFSICTHDPDTGILTDADAVPAYRVYEDETGVAIATGNMAKLDDANTTGFYTELLAVTSANGYEAGKTYTVYIEATVDGNKGGISLSFKIISDLSVADIVAGIADGSYDLQEMLRIMFAALAGKTTGGGTTTLAFRDSADSKDRISATVDDDGNRTAVTLNGA